jgi:MFS family permease
VSGYVDLPEGWTRVSSSGPGPFVTTEIVRAPDGGEQRWESRRHRKQSPAWQRRSTDASQATEESVWWRPRRRGWWMAVLFVIGALCFTIGGIASQWAATPRSWIGVTFFVGSLFFTSAAYLQYAEAVNAERGLGPRTHPPRWRPASWEPKRIDWLATVVQLIGTFLFNISTFAALHHNLTTKQANARVWAPDAFGSIAFLISSELAFAEVCHRWLSFRNRTLGWRIVALNLLGSIAFGASAIASLVEPSSGEPVSARIANAGTSVGGLCFLIGALLLMPEAAKEQRAAEAEPTGDDDLASTSSQTQ